MNGEKARYTIVGVVCLLLAGCASPPTVDTPSVINMPPVTCVLTDHPHQQNNRISERWKGVR